MLVRDRMTTHPVVIHDDTAVADALKLMRTNAIRHLPVVNQEGQLTGVVSEKDLVGAFPSPMAPLIARKISEFLHVLKVKKVMTPKVVTIPEDATIEEAAILMFSCHISGLPVMRGKTLVGIITATDLYKVFLSLLGARSPGARITVLVRDAKGTIARITEAIFKAGGTIVGLGTSEFAKSDDRLRECVFKVQGIPAAQLVDAVGPLVHQVTDLRQQ